MKKLSKKLVIPSFFHKNFLKLFLYTKRKLIFNINFFFLFYKAPPTNLLYIKKKPMPLQCFGTVHLVYLHCSSNSGNLVRHFVFFFFFKVSNISYSPRRHCSYSSYNFFLSSVCTFFFYIYFFTDTTNFTIIEVSISYKSR